MLVEAVVIFSILNRYPLENKNCEVVVSKDKKSKTVVSEVRGCQFSRADIIRTETTETLRISYDVPEDEKFLMAEFQYQLNKGQQDAKSGLAIFTTGPKDNDLNTYIPIPELDIGGATLLEVPCWTVHKQTVASQLTATVEPEDIEKTTYSWVLWRKFWPLYEKAAKNQVRVTSIDSSTLTMDAVLQDRKINSCIEQSVK